MLLLLFFPDFSTLLQSFDSFFAHNVLCCGQAGGAQTDNRCRCVVFCAPTALLQNFCRQLPRRRVRRQIKKVLDTLSIHTVAE